MAKEILVVDNNESFALMLHDSIKRETEHEVSICTSAGDARESLAQATYDLAIVDFGLEDEDPVTLMRDLRRQQHNLRLMAIPVMDEELPSEVADLEIQGVLPKPFFIGDLADIIDAALKVPFPSEKPAVKAAIAIQAEDDILTLAGDEHTSASQKMAGIDDRAVKVISDLHREIAAQMVILAGPAGVSVHSGEINGVESDAVRQALAQLSHAAASTLYSLSGEETDITSHQGYCESAGQRLYWLALDHGWLLACVLDSELPLGMLRYHFRHAAAQLAPLVA